MAMEGYGLPDMRQTECLRFFLVSFVPFVVGNMNGLNAYGFQTDLSNIDPRNPLPVYQTEPRTREALSGCVWSTCVAAMIVG